MIPEFPVCAEVGEFVFGALRLLHLAGKAQPMTSLPNQIQSDVAHGDVLFKDGAVATPFRESLSQNQGIVSQPEKHLKRFVLRHDLHVVDLIGQLIKGWVSVHLVVRRVKQQVLVVGA